MRSATNESAIISPAPSFDFNNFNADGPGYDALAMGNGVFFDHLDFGDVHMDLGNYTMPFDWVGSSRLLSEMLN